MYFVLMVISLTHRAKSNGNVCFCFRGSNYADPLSVISARNTEAFLITQWVTAEKTRLKTDSALHRFA